MRHRSYMDRADRAPYSERPRNGTNAAGARQLPEPIHDIIKSTQHLVSSVLLSVRTLKQSATSSQLLLIHTRSVWPAMHATEPAPIDSQRSSFKPACAI